MFPPIDLNKDPGEYELNLRAYVASIVGPRRIVHGKRAVKQVPLAAAGRGIKLYGSNGSGKFVTFVELWLPASSIVGLGGGGAIFAVGPSDLGGSENANQIAITATQRFQCVLLNDDALYAVAVSDAAGGALAASVPLTVSSVVF